MSTQWEYLLTLLKEYWVQYGGFKSLIGSPYLHVSVIITLLTYGYWTNNDWWGQSLLILPSLLGFTLVGFAIFLGFGSDDFRSLMSKKINGTSPYLDVVSSYTHFVVTQLLAIVSAVVMQGASYVNPFSIPDKYNSVLQVVSGFFGYGLMVYSLILSIAVCMSIFDVASIYADYNTDIEDKSNTKH